jgi:hypothetical protein
VLAIHRWVDSIGRDMLVVTSLNESDLFGYPLPLPVGGVLQGVFNASAYDIMPTGDGYNAGVPGNPGGIDGNGRPLEGRPNSTRVTIPANGFLVFGR